MGASDQTSIEAQDVLNYLDGRRNRIFSRIGGWFPGKGVYNHGYSMLDELIGKVSYFQVLILNATGRLVERNLADWVEAICGCLSWPDPRIWCNQIGALAGTARASNLVGTVMGCLATDSRTYGVYPIIEGVQFIQHALAQQCQGVTPSSIVEKAVGQSGGKPMIVGYVRPIAKGDERLERMEEISRHLGIAPGPHLQLAYDIEKVMKAKYGEGMNINGYVAAVLSDHGFSPQEVYQIFPTAVASGVTACYRDAYLRPPESFLPLRCDDVVYQGPAFRVVPPVGEAN
ncbi:hypothetical protein CJA_0758 [Cellvibrio japonicus Ueda107]|uniref:Uncharacterized protein n=2 Tax=Cellvibrio japonicus TaxID=155077 RepID=B3PK95_CELJU|nr:hypothetical protein CJA_0758 [Cellvibrio japonicus Ueda107]QEI14067.1 hypothetical protein FY117_03660 [Cellvibrio japonicus]QEI17642.1 hypothetical protein FY116_03660 [Cellvibrio japonicus]QEI21216.1 hypothetical protein FY115_03660 [Cellvibrio japonicus]